MRRDRLAFFLFFFFSFVDAGPPFGILVFLFLLWFYWLCCCSFSLSSCRFSFLFFFRRRWASVWHFSISLLTVFIVFVVVPFRSFVAFLYFSLTSFLSFLFLFPPSWRFSFHFSGDVGPPFGILAFLSYSVLLFFVVVPFRYLGGLPVSGLISKSGIDQQEIYI